METVSVQKLINGNYEISIQHNETGSSIGITVSEDALFKIGRLTNEIKIELSRLPKECIKAITCGIDDACYLQVSGQGFCTERKGMKSHWPVRADENDI